MQEDRYIQYFIEMKAAIAGIDQKLTGMKDAFKDHVAEDKLLSAKVDEVEEKVIKSEASMRGATKMLTLLISLLGAISILVSLYSRV